LLLGLVFVSPAANAQRASQPVQQTCENIDPSTERACADRRIAGKEQSLEATFPWAMQSVRENFACYGQRDKRSDPSYLRRSETARTQYVDNDCKVQAACGGASNSAISDRERHYENALDKRIQSLRHLADGAIGAG